MKIASLFFDIGFKKSIWMFLEKIEEMYEKRGLELKKKLDKKDSDFFTHIWVNRYAKVTSYRDYHYTGINFNVVSGNRFSTSDSVSGVFRLDCALAGGTGDCLSLPSADYTAAVSFCSFTASGTPDLVITCADDLSSGFTFKTDADGRRTEIICAH